METGEEGVDNGWNKIPDVDGFEYHFDGEVFYVRRTGETIAGSIGHDWRHNTKWADLIMGKQKPKIQPFADALLRLTQ